MEANGRQSSSETVAILSSLLNGLQVDPTYRLPGAHAPGPRPVRPAGRHQHGHRGVGPTRGAGRVRLIPNAGHASNLDNPEAFTQVLEKFLHRVTQPGGETAA
jgi:hypothetical protein